MPFSLREGRMEAKVATSTLSPSKEGPPAVPPQAVPFGWPGQRRVPGPEPRSCRGTRSSLQHSAVTTELSLLSWHHSAGTMPWHTQPRLEVVSAQRAEHTTLLFSFQVSCKQWPWHWDAFGTCTPCCIRRWPWWGGCHRLLQAAQPCCWRAAGSVSTRCCWPGSWPPKKVQAAVLPGSATPKGVARYCWKQNFLLLFSPVPVSIQLRQNTALKELAFPSALQGTGVFSPSSGRSAAWSSHCSSK